MSSLGMQPNIVEYRKKWCFIQVQDCMITYLGVCYNAFAFCHLFLVMAPGPLPGLVVLLCCVLTFSVAGSWLVGAGGHQVIGGSWPLSSGCIKTALSW